jgi:hexose oxidase
VSQSPTRGGNSGKPILLSDQQGFDRRWFAPNLKAVYAPSRLEEVAGCVADALVNYGKDVKVTSGRHCYENFVYNDSTLAVIDMSGIDEVGFDNERYAYFVDAGCENWSVYRSLLNTHGKTLPAGSCYSVGAGGHITGGGYGLLSRMHGLTIDYLTAVDVVTWDAASGQATLRHVSNESASEAERDLFWALRGAGGGNFGVIVRYYFEQLPDAPDYATLFSLAWDWSQVTQEIFSDLVEFYAALMPLLPDNEFTALRLSHVAAGQLGMTLQVASLPGMSYDQHCQHASERAQTVKQFFDKVLPAVHLQKPLNGHPGYMSSITSSLTEHHLTYLEAVQQLNGSGPNQFGKYKSAYMKKGFPADQIATIYTFLHDTPNGPGNTPLDMAQCLLQVDSYGGAINRVSPNATAVPQRSSIMKLQYQAYWNNAAGPGQANESPYREMAQGYLDWINQFYAEVYAAMGGTPDPLKDPSGTVDGCYYNYADSVLGTHADERIDQAMWLYFLDNFRNNERNLVEVKRYWDPENYFNHPQSIPLHSVEK